MSDKGKKSISNEEIEKQIPMILMQYKKGELLKEVEKELGLRISLKGFNDVDDTFSKETMAEILLGIRRLKGES